MKLIKKIESRRDKSGHLRKWAIFKCPECLQEVERLLYNGRKAQSCGCISHKLQAEAIKGENNPFYGKHHTKETRQKISIANKGNSFGKGKIVSKESRQKISIANKGKEAWNKGMTSKDDNRILNGENNPNWQGGKSFEIYPQEFKQMKEYILERDNYTCQYPGCTEIHDRLHVHHIDYNKQNNNSENLITLGTSCHTKTNYNRQYWTEFYQNIIEKEYMK